MVFHWWNILLCTCMLMGFINNYSQYFQIRFFTVKKNLTINKIPNVYCEQVTDAKSRKQGKGSRSSSISSEVSSSYQDPLSSTMEGSDPLSQFVAEATDPLSMMMAESAAAKSSGPDVVSH